jgi:hypothetical protein
MLAVLAFREKMRQLSVGDEAQRLLLSGNPLFPREHENVCYPTD